MKLCSIIYSKRTVCFNHYVISHQRLLCNKSFQKETPQRDTTETAQNISDNLL